METGLRAHARLPRPELGHHERHTYDFPRRPLDYDLAVNSRRERAAVVVVLLEPDPDVRVFLAKGGAEVMKLYVEGRLSNDTKNRD